MKYILYEIQYSMGFLKKEKAHRKPFIRLVPIKAWPLKHLSQIKAGPILYKQYNKFKGSEIPNRYSQAHLYKPIILMGAGPGSFELHWVRGGGWWTYLNLSSSLFMYWNSPQWMKRLFLCGSESMHSMEMLHHPLKSNTACL